MSAPILTWEEHLALLLWDQKAEERAVLEPFLRWLRARGMVTDIRAESAGVLDAYHRIDRPLLERAQLAVEQRPLKAGGEPPS